MYIFLSIADFSTVCCITGERLFNFDTPLRIASNYFEIPDYLQTIKKILERFSILSHNSS